MFKQQTNNQYGDTISRLWLFAFLMMIFRDLHEMSTESTIRGILAGTFEGNPVTDEGLLMGGVALSIMAITFVLSTLLNPSAARKLNLFVTPITVAGMFVLPPNDPDDYLLGAMTASAFVGIFYLSWTWKVTPQISMSKEVNHAC